MHDFLSEIFIFVLQLAGVTADDASERVQGVIVLVAAAAFAAVSGLFCGGIVASVLFALAGFCAVACILIGYGVIG